MNCAIIWPDATGLDKMICHHLEEVRVQALAVIVRPLDGPAHAGRQPLHLHANALTVHTALVPCDEKWIGDFWFIFVRSKIQLKEKPWFVNYWQRSSELRPCDLGRILTLIEPQIIFF